MAVVLNIHGKKTRTSLDITNRVVRLGRSPECDFKLHDDRCSSLHCEIKHTSEGVFIKDLNSRNGTFVDNCPVLEGKLKLNQIGQIGKIRFYIDYDQLNNLEKKQLVESSRTDKEFQKMEDRVRDSIEREDKIRAGELNIDQVQIEDSKQLTQSRKIVNHRFRLKQQEKIETNIGLWGKVKRFFS
jgi:pSer/pThr/pTyr-binding forkhead associated (FHA) protein